MTAVRCERKMRATGNYGGGDGISMRVKVRRVMMVINVAGDGGEFLSSDIK